MAKDLLKIDFSPPAEAPEEFRVVAFNAEVKKKQSEALAPCIVWRRSKWLLAGQNAC